MQLDMQLAQCSCGHHARVKNFTARRLQGLRYVAFLHSSFKSTHSKYATFFKGWTCI